METKNSIMTTKAPTTSFEEAMNKAKQDLKKIEHEWELRKDEILSSIKEGKCDV